MSKNVPAQPEAASLAPGEFSVPGELVMGVLHGFEGSARLILIAMMRGQSRRMAAVAGGVSIKSIERWLKEDPRFREAYDLAESIGLAGTVESELYRRAMAGPDDRGSIRALELVLKSRDAAYREKSQVQMEIVTRNQDAKRDLVAGWDEPDSERT